MKAIEPVLFARILQTMKVCNNEQHCWDLMEKANMAALLKQKAAEIPHGLVFLPVPPINNHPAMAIFRTNPAKRKLLIICIGPEFKEHTVPFFITYMNVMLGERVKDVEVQLTDHVGPGKPQAVSDNPFDLPPSNPANN